MTEHKLKTWPEYFHAHADGRKNFEARKNDRNFQVGDVLLLEEFVPYPNAPDWVGPERGVRTGRMLPREVTYILRGPSFGVLDGWCVMATRFPMIGWAREDYDRG